MLIKFVGMAITFGVMAFAGFYYGNLDSFRLADLMAMKRALAILRAEIEFAQTPLPEALLNISRKAPKPVGHIFLRLEEALHIHRDQPLSALWEKTLLEFAGQTYFSQEDTGQLLAFGKTLGYLDKGMQIQNIDMVTAYITETMAGLQESRKKSRRLFPSLGILGGLLVVVIFL